MASISRYQKEREFHNRAFTEGTRERVGKFYAIVRSSRNFYEQFLLSQCKHKDVLEYGCGPGSYSFLLCRAGAAVTGIDISDNAIIQANKMALQEHLKIAFHVMNAEFLEFNSNSFDLICGEGILHHLDINKAFSELARTLRPNGTAIFMEPLGHNPLINLYRKITPHLRTEDEHPLLMGDLKLAKMNFGKVEMYFFYLHSLLAVPFRNFQGFTLMLKVLDAADRVLFRVLPFSRRYAWEVVIVLSQPNKSRL
jgi:SAM-dependent methyltransferase